MNSSKVVEMKKIELLLTMYDENEVEGQSASFTFVFGLESSGLTPFEKELFGKSVGDRLRLQPSVSELQSFFGSCYLPICQALQCSAFAALLLSVEVVAVQDAESREIVQQLARSAGDCGCGDGSCDCGCG